MGFALGWIGALLGAALVAAYYVFALGHAPSLERWLRAPRRVAFTAALVLSSAPLAAPATSPGFAARAAPSLIVLACLSFASWRQWLWPRPARAAAALGDALDGAALVAVVPGGDALSIDALARRRALRVGPWTVVHCSLARSLSVFRSSSAPALLSPSLPLASGFEVTAGGRRWDGADGRARDGGAHLVRGGIALCTHAAWRQAFPRATLHGDRSAAAIRADRVPVPRVQAARGVAEPMELGVVRAGTWVPLSPHELERCPSWAGAAIGDEVYLSRWAARARGLA